jgi:hypothetical protein
MTDKDFDRICGEIDELLSDPAYENAQFELEHLLRNITDRGEVTARQARTLTSIKHKHARRRR